MNLITFYLKNNRSDQIVYDNNNNNIASNRARQSVEIFWYKNDIKTNHSCFFNFYQFGFHLECLN